MSPFRDYPAVVGRCNDEASDLVVGQGAGSRAVVGFIQNRAVSEAPSGELMVEPQLCSCTLTYELAIQRNRLAVGQVLRCLRQAGHDGRHADLAGSEPDPDGCVAVLAWNEDGYVNLVPANLATFTRAPAAAADESSDQVRSGSGSRPVARRAAASHSEWDGIRLPPTGAPHNQAG